MEKPGAKTWKSVAPFVWHGFFLAVTMAMIEPNTVLPTLVSSLTTNTVLFGLMYSILLGAPLVFNLPFSLFQQRFARHRQFLLIGIYVRTLSFVAMALVVLRWAKTQPDLALLNMAFLILIFAASGGFAGLAYSDLIGRLIPTEQRPRLFAARQVVGGVGSLIGGLFLSWVFRPANLAFPLNYTISLLAGAGGLLLGALGFWFIREPMVDTQATGTQRQTGTVIKPGIMTILRRDHGFRRFIIIENMSSFGLMLLPFYMVLIKNRFAGATDWIGVFIIAQTAGSIGSNLVWAWVARKFSPRLVIRLCMTMGGIIPLLALLFSMLGIGWFVLLFLMIGFVISGRNIGFEPYLLELAPAPQRILYLGIRGSLGILLAVLPLLGGLLIARIGFASAFILVATVMLATAWLFPKTKQPPPG
jgi:MFS family permease